MTSSRVHAAPIGRAEVVRRQALSRRARLGLVFDLVLFVSFGVAYTFNFTGLSLHEWFGLAFGTALFMHLTLHWDWALQTTRRLVSTTGRRRVMWVVDLLLLVDMVLCVTSGIAISTVAIPALGLPTAAGSGYWSELHMRTASFAVVLIALHIGLDFRWLMGVIRRVRRNAGR